MKNNKKLTLFLATALIAIWGTIGYRIYSGYSSIDDSDIATTTIIEKSDVIRYEFQKDVRDPFEVMTPIPKKHAAISATTGIIKEDDRKSPPYKLNGIIIDKERRIAILEGPDGITSFLGERDSINGIVIMNIEASHVEYSFLGNRHRWRIEQ